MVAVLGKLAYAVGHEVKRWWREARTDERWVLTLGAALVLSGLGHLVVWAVLGGSLEGPVSWRKPIVFGLSAGVTTWSIAWVMRLLPATRTRGVLARSYVVTMALEVSLITMQQWRGVGSHFNGATPFDAVVFAVMGVLILIASVTVVVFAVQVFRARSLDADIRAAAVPALALLLAGIAGGLIISSYGSVLSAVNPGADVRTVGAAGVARFPHGVALHAIQVLPVLLWFLRRGTEGATQRVRILRFAATGYTAVFLFAAWQTLAGRAPSDPTLALGVWLVGGVALLVYAFALALFAVLRLGATGALLEPTHARAAAPALPDQSPFTRA